MKDSSQIALLGMDRDELASLVGSVGERAYRARQIAEAVYRQRVAAVEEISTLSQQLRVKLEEKGVSIGLPKIEQRFVSQDGTVRYLIGFADGQSVETVWMPEGDGGEAGDGSEAGEQAERFADLNLTEAEARLENGKSIAALKRCATQKQRLSQRLQGQNQGRSTICISSQVGCAVDCQFCLTALLGVKRNLTAGEIVGQVCAVLRDRNVSPPEDRINLVFMGMGEPFLNYDNFVKAARLLVEEIGIAERRMTVSTAGIVPRIHDFGGEKIRPKLAISLNASNDALRTRLMPLNKKWNLEMLMAAARAYPLRTREWITFEYVLLGGVNDGPENAREVVELLRGMRCKVNLIALNPGPGIEFTTPGAERVGEFQTILRAAGIPAFVRRPRGRDIYAACGQLKRTVETATSPAL
ncbi:MAG TPA: 23S rRNA (adenine(2503)-C(2))-methyltransferase RlmN [Candidatus Sulfotelmatobacter sp.]|nr:23S rRNA (adenine(2503)-C(2))-methyltransferase RlmN [Candidatus Sulfotelmatobacter sp.]